MAEVVTMRLGESKLILLAAGLIALACSDPGSLPVTDVTTNVGDTVTVTLETFGAGSFEDPIFSSPVVRLVDSASVPPQNSETLRQVFRFEALTKGRVEILFRHTAQRERIVDIVVTN
jgi:hypothetical protein